MRCCARACKGTSVSSRQTKGTRGQRLEPWKVGLDQYGLSPLELSPLDILRWAVDHGADGVHFSGFEPEWQQRLDHGCLQELRMFAESQSLYLEWGGAGHIPRDMTNWSVRDLFDANHIVATQAEHLGVQIVRSCSGGLMRWTDAAPSTEILLRETATALRAQREMLRDHGVILAIELHFEFTTYELLRLFEMCDASPGDWLGVVLDTMNVLTMLEEPVRATERILPWVVSTHLKDGGVRSVPAGWETFPTAIGQGVVDLSGVIRHLERSDRSIHLSVEDHGGSFSLPIRDESFLAKFPDATEEEMTAIATLARRTQQADHCVPTERADWPALCEARMSQNLIAAKRLVADAGLS